MKKHTTIYFVRHAKSVYDPSILDEERILSEKGVQQAEELVAKLSPLEIDAIYSSYAKRAHDTIALFAKKSGLDIELFPEFRERQLPDQGTFENFIKTIKNTFADFDFKVEGWESARECLDSFFPKVVELAEKNSGKNIVISSHGLAISLFLNKIDSSWGYDEWCALPMPAIIRVSYENVIKELWAVAKKCKQE